MEGELPVPLSADLYPHKTRLDQEGFPRKGLGQLQGGGVRAGGNLMGRSGAWGAAAGFRRIPEGGRWTL